MPRVEGSPEAGPTPARPDRRRSLGLSRAALAGVLLLASCSVGPTYHRPGLDLPAGYTSPPMPHGTPPDLGWWRGFHSAELDRLITAALAASPDVAAAVARVQQADQAVAIAGSPLLPQVNGTLGQSWQRTGTGGGQSFTLGGRTFGSSGHYVESRSYSAELSAAYEIDFWGKNRDALHAAQALADASRFDLETVRLTTEAAVANTYFQALSFRDRLAIAERNLADQEQVLAAFRGRLSVGTASLLDVSQQEALVAGTRATIPQFRSQYRQQVIALGILVGLPPERVTLDPVPLVSLNLPPVAAGLPGDVLRRRPDVASAESALVSQNYTVKQDFANFFPSVTLTAGGGLASAALSAITGPGTLVANFASQLAQTIFDNGLKEGTLGQARGRFRELAADYAKTVLQALTDVETALTEVHFDAEQETLEAEAVRTARRSAEIARAQLAAGTVDIVTVLNTEATLFGDEDTLAQVRLARFLALVLLYEALGGGWTLPA